MSQRVIDQVYHGLDPRLTSDAQRSGVLPVYTEPTLGPDVFSGDQDEATEHEEMPSEEYDCVMRAWRIAEKHGYRVRLIDVAKESEFRAWIQTHRHEIKEYPVLLLPNGSRLNGPGEFTEERLQAVLSVGHSA